jgi:hypothetical protein
MALSLKTKDYIMKKTPCIYSLLSCERCDEQQHCRKINILTTEKDLKKYVNACDMGGKMWENIQVVFATDHAATRKNPTGLWPCLLRTSFFGIRKQVLWLDPKFFNPQYVAYLYLKEK